MAQIESILDPNKLCEYVDTVLDEEEKDDKLSFDGSDDDLGEEERFLQHTILRNFMGRSKNTNLLDA